MAVTMVGTIHKAQTTTLSCTVAKSGSGANWDAGVPLIVGDLLVSIVTYDADSAGATEDVKCSRPDISWCFGPEVGDRLYAGGVDGFMAMYYLRIVDAAHLASLTTNYTCTLTNVASGRSFSHVMYALRGVACIGDACAFGGATATISLGYGGLLAQTMVPGTFFIASAMNSQAYVTVGEGNGWTTSGGGMTWTEDVDAGQVGVAHSWTHAHATQAAATPGGLSPGITVAKANGAGDMLAMLIGFAPTAWNAVLPDATPPVVANVTPAPASVISPTTPIVFDVTDLTPGFEHVSVTVERAGDGRRDDVHDGTTFAGLYTSGGSTRTAITNGFQFSIRPGGGWSGSSITVRIIALDGDGNETLVSNSWTINEVVAPALTLAIGSSPGGLVLGLD